MTNDEACKIYHVRYVGREKNADGDNCHAFVDPVSGYRLRVLHIDDLPDGLLVARSRDSGNKRDARRRARKLSADFHEFKPRKLQRSEFRWPKSLASLGPCVQVDYLSDKFDGKGRRYFHEFEGRAELLADPEPQADGSRLLIIRGDFQIKPDGITG